MWGKAAVAVCSLLLLSCQSAVDQQVPTSDVYRVVWPGEAAGMTADVELLGSLYRTSNTAWLSVRNGARLRAVAEGVWCGTTEDPFIDTNGMLICFYDDGSRQFDRIVIMSRSSPMAEFELRHGIPFATVDDRPSTWPTMHTEPATL